MDEMIKRARAAHSLIADSYDRLAAARERFAGADSEITKAIGEIMAGTQELRLFVELIIEAIEASGDE